MKIIILFLSSLLVFISAHAGSVRVGSKAFTEGFLISELAAQKIERATGQIAQRKFGLGNTGIVFEALKKGEIDFYPEYTGTIQEAILHRSADTTRRDLIEALAAQGLVISEPLGFSNTYALAVTKEFAEANALVNISDLRRVDSQIRAAFSHEFTTRVDGLTNLQKAYRLNIGNSHQSLEHSLAYQAISSRVVNLIDVYSTDAQIERLKLVVLKDDLGFFPSYEAVFLAKKDFVDKSSTEWASLNSLAGSINEQTMRRLNASVEMDKKSFSNVISDFLGQGKDEFVASGTSLWSGIWQRTQEHLFLVGVTVFFSVLTGVPLGIFAFRNERLGQFLILGSSVVQTIPSLALLCLLIPFFGIGTWPALIALYLYGLLPILLNTYIGLSTIDPRLLETAQALGLNSVQKVFWIELPLASRSIIGGIKTATIIGIGTATLAALIGAGGYGAPIVSGLAINDMNTVLTGAIPAACLSLVAHFGFEILSYLLVPKGLRA